VGLDHQPARGPPRSRAARLLPHTRPRSRLTHRGASAARPSAPVPTPRGLYQILPVPGTRACATALPPR
jgi:hypothetical protein